MKLTFFVLGVITAFCYFLSFATSTWLLDTFTSLNNEEVFRKSIAFAIPIPLLICYLANRHWAKDHDEFFAGTYGFTLTFLALLGLGVKFEELGILAPLFLSALFVPIAGIRAFAINRNVMGEQPPYIPPKGTTPDWGP